MCKNGGAPSVAGHVVRWHVSVCVLLGCGRCCRPSVRTVLVLDKSLASIEAEDRWENACDCRVPAARLSRLKTFARIPRTSDAARRAARWPQMSSALYQRPRIHVVASVGRATLRYVLSEFMRRREYALMATSAAAYSSSWLWLCAQTLQLECSKIK